MELGGFNERVGRCCPLTSGVGAGKHIVLPAQSQRPDGALGGVVADLQSSVVEIARERSPARTRVTDRTSQFTPAGDRRERGIEERGKVIDGGTRSELADAPALVS